MNGFVGEDLKSQIRAANDIVEVIQWLNVPLKKMGSRYRALCPFHQEKTPSFHVNPQRQSFHCFGCGAGGDVFKFVMLREGVDFPMALRRLAERSHISIPENTGYFPDSNRELRKQLYDLHQRVRDWFHSNLMRARQADAARAYLHGREFNASIAKEFQLGYALPGWDGLIRWGDAHGVNVSLLQEAGLVVVGDRGPYDRFRDRLMIPIADEMGRIVGFSGRILMQNAKEAKYVNSPETAIFKKGRLLFGLDRSKRDMQEAKRAVICEGQLDWIRCFNSGIKNVIAPQGTALTEEQARLLNRYVEEVILCFDSDRAGQNASWRNAETLIAAGLSVRAVRIPDGEDPDSFIRKKGAEALKKCIEEAVDVFEYKAVSLVQSINMHDPRNHKKVVQEMIPLLVLVENEPQRQRLIHNVCDIFKMDVQAFLSEFRRFRQHSRPSSSAIEKHELQRVKTMEDRPQDQWMGYGDYLLWLSLTEESAARMLADHLEEVWFTTYRLKHVLFHIIRNAKKGAWKPGWDGLDLELSDDDKEQIARLLTSPMKMSRRDMAAGLQQTIERVHVAYLIEQHHDRSRLLQNPDLSEEDRLRLQTELLDLNRHMKQV